MTRAKSDPTGAEFALDAGSGLRRATPRARFGSVVQPNRFPNRQKMLYILPRNCFCALFQSVSEDEAFSRHRRERRGGGSWFTGGFDQRNASAAQRQPGQRQGREKNQSSRAGLTITSVRVRSMRMDCLSPPSYLPQPDFHPDVNGPKFFCLAMGAYSRAPRSDYGRRSCTCT